jgi:dipeptidyl aminopeptidase/acylaminoacyl peptidase
MPMRPVYRPPVRRRRVSRWAVLGGIAGVLVLALGIKLLFFPGPKLVVTGAFSAVAPKWSPTGRHFAFAQAGADLTRLGVYDLRTGKHRDLADLNGGDASAYAWSPDGKRIAYVGNAERGWGDVVFVVDVESGKSRRVANGRMPAWAPDGTTLLMWCAGERGFDEVAAPVISENGDVIDPGEMSYSVREPSGLCRVNAETGEVIRRTEDSEDTSFGWRTVVSPVLGKVAFEKAGDKQPTPPPSRSGDGAFVDMVDSVAARGAKNMAESSRDLSRELEARERARKRDAGKTPGYVRDVYVSDFDGGPPRPLTSDGRSGSPVWTPDGERILFAGDGGLWLMNADGSGRQQAFKGKLADPPAAELTADGRYVLFVAPVEANAGVAQLMTGETPEDLHIARVGSSTAKRLANRHPFKQRFAVSPDGKRIVYEVLAETGTLTQRGGRSELWMMRR